MDISFNKKSMALFKEFANLCTEKGLMGGRFEIDTKLRVSNFRSIQNGCYIAHHKTSLRDWYTCDFILGYDRICSIVEGSQIMVLAPYNVEVFSLHLQRAVNALKE